MKKHPIPTVSAFIFSPENKLLLCRSAKWQDRFVIPGGRVEWGEKLEDALRREVWEETGLEVYDLQLISLNESLFSKKFSNPRHFIFIDYFCRSSSTKVTLNEEAEEYVWVEIDQIDQYPLGGYLQEFFREYSSEQSGHLRQVFYNYISE